MIWSTLGRVIYWTIGAVQAVAEGVSSGKRLVRQMRKGIVPHVDDTQPIPLSHRDSERIVEFARHAGHETFRDVDSGKYASRLADAKPGPLKR